MKLLDRIFHSKILWIIECILLFLWIIDIVIALFFYPIKSSDFFVLLGFGVLVLIFCCWLSYNVFWNWDKFSK